jgi:uncharacterized LabA/DUF88 family protein
MTQVMAYVDGFNLYHGIKARHGRRYLWLDLEGLARRLLKPGQRLAGITYFTASVRNDPAALARQNAYLSALRAVTSVEVVRGRFQHKRATCHSCGASWTTYEEKETDVNIAVRLVEDAALQRYDTALVISADSDLCPAVRSAKRLHPSGKVVIVFPPNRHSDELKRAGDSAFSVGDAVLRRAQLPETVTDHRGVVFTCPATWK